MELQDILKLVLFVLFPALTFLMYWIGKDTGAQEERRGNFKTCSKCKGYGRTKLKDENKSLLEGK